MEYLNCSIEETVKDWKETPVMFVLQNPGRSVNDRFATLDNGRMPITDTWPYIGWYQKDKPEHFVFEEEIRSQGHYGEMFCSIILKYKLKNAYVTNLVKCGVGESEPLKKKNYVCIEKVIDCCFEAIFMQEVNAIKPKHIFAFGDIAYIELKKRLPLNSELYWLPHPAAWPYHMPSEKRIELNLKALCVLEKIS